MQENQPGFLENIPPKMANPAGIEAFPNPIFFPQILIQLLGVQGMGWSRNSQDFWGGKRIPGASRAFLGLSLDISRDGGALDSLGIPSQYSTKKNHSLLPISPAFIPNPRKPLEKKIWDLLEFPFSSCTFPTSPHPQINSRNR